MRRKIIKFTLAAACLLATGQQSAAADKFDAIDGAAEQLQSRRYEVKDPVILLRASLAILQDIRYQITQSEVEPGLLVAEAPFRSCWCKRSVTISVQAAQGRTDNYRVRITASSAVEDNFFISQEQPDYTDFYQDFFAQLDRELFKERQQ